MPRGWRGTGDARAVENPVLQGFPATARQYRGRGARGQTAHSAIRCRNRQEVPAWSRAATCPHDASGGRLRALSSSPRPVAVTRPPTPEAYLVHGRRTLHGAFVLSGVAGLTYEVLWSRYLGLFVGHGAYAQVLVLAVFLGGMAVGSLAISGRSRTLARPLLGYAALEV